jgi:hypothetical protein
MKEMQKKQKDTKYTRQNKSSPSNQSIRMSNTKFPSQSSKARSIKEFGENISQLSLCVTVSHLDISLFHMISQEVVSHFDVFHSFVED